MTHCCNAALPTAALNIDWSASRLEAATVVGQYATLCVQDRCGTGHADCGSLQGFGEELLTRCLNIVSGLLADDLYFARRQGGHLATVLYRKWARPQVSTSLMSALAPFALDAVVKQPALNCDWPDVPAETYIVAKAMALPCEGAAALVSNLPFCRSHVALQQ